MDNKKYCKNCETYHEKPHPCFSQSSVWNEDNQAWYDYWADGGSHYDGNAQWD